MPSAGGNKSGSPMIAGSAMSGSGFTDLPDDEILSTGLFDFENSPDTLQTFGSANSAGSKMFITPQELQSAESLPDSPNGSGQDSSSESAPSVKRDGSSEHSPQNMANGGEIGMGSDMEGGMDWDSGDFPDHTHDHDPYNTFSFGQSTTSPSIDDVYPFGADDSFLNSSFDVSAADDGMTSGAVTAMPSPGMPTIESDDRSNIKAESAKKPPARTKRPRKKPQQQQEQQVHPQHNMPTVSAQPTQASESREISPMSQVMGADNGVQGTAMQTSPQSAVADFPGNMSNGTNGWVPNMNAAHFTMTRDLPFHGSLNGQAGISGQNNRSYHHSPYPPGYFFSNGPYELLIFTRPTKSRVETQIPITMVLNPLPPGIRRLHLPTHKISKPKLLAKPPVAPAPDMLELHVSLVCTTAMEKSDLQEKALKRAREAPHKYLPREDEELKPQEGDEVFICKGCIMRERKRAGRKKIKHVADELMWTQDEQHRAIVFNTKEVQVWEPLENLFDSEVPVDTGLPRGTMQCSIPLRIACYCRHHGEKTGFKVIFTLKDWEGNTIAQTMSRSIMITDDHKTHAADKDKTIAAGSKRGLPDHISAANANVPATAFTAPAPSSSQQPIMNANLNALPPAIPTNFQTSPNQAVATSSTTISRPQSTPNSPGQVGPSAKKRKSSGGSRVPNDLTMTRLETSVSPGPTGPGSQISTAASPFSPNMNPFPSGEQLFGQPGPLTTGPPTPNNNDQIPFFGAHRSGSMDNLTMAQLYSAPTSNHPSRAPSPNGLRNSMAGPQAQLGQAVSNSLNSLYTMPMSMSQARPPPTIHKIVPAEGPTSGGIDVTILGSSFFSGLEVWFGEQKATTTTYWGEPSLVCLLPPSAVSGMVPVILKNQLGQVVQTLGRTPQMFRYLDDNEDKLIRTALSVLGHKMSGQMMDVSELARRILNDSGSSNWGGNSGGQSSGSGPAFNQASREHLESQLLKCLDLIDLDDSPHRTFLDLKSETGHTMLHLASSLGYHRFVAALLARGANPNARDLGGFTPLHMAAMRDHPEIVRRLMLAGANSSARSLSKLKVADVAKSRSVLRAIQRSVRHARSRSGGSLHSRASSTSSLRSLWEPITKIRTHDGTRDESTSPDSSEESPEYTTSDYEDEDEQSDEQEEYIQMRRPSGFHQETEKPNVDQLDEGLPSPTMNAMTAAFKEHLQQQFHQFQQSMALHFQNLPHLPQMPQMPQMPNFPNMPVLPDYQAYLQQRPFMRKVTQLMPGKPGSRPDSQDSDSAKSDSKWWALSTYMNNTGALPPAYEDIFPQDARDTKELSAAQAATEAAADEKCAQQFDYASSSPDEKRTKVEVPSVLKIGRKDAITKEQQEQFLEAQKQKYKRLSNDRNLFFIWIPLLLVMVCAMLYNYCPSLFTIAFSYAMAALNKGVSQASRLLSRLEDRDASTVTV